MPVKALVHHPGHVTRGTLGVGELPTQAAAILLEGPRAGPLPHQSPANRCMVATHGGKVVLRLAEIRLSPHHLLKVALLLGRQGLAGDLCVLQVAGSRS